MHTHTHTLSLSLSLSRTHTYTEVITFPNSLDQNGKTSVLPGCQRDFLAMWSHTPLLSHSDLQLQLHRRAAHGMAVGYTMCKLAPKPAGGCCFSWLG
ncbi:uncharacterized protein GLRG_04229 [Colletotrichum graminicola M1.001]|uniref:Uncharacterized protein n=1 Tax=Colletotrichum graminicola (strain M1.001 / M2 / FGSC 10212) TaxID=645133 RepID=E3QDZ7_COLGM|nr:uncharacterized protein GLRG_04229 [Colletotrichum graminicola M1.001]EFQ29085.1 hypothetical protein GLRG_04229 [Colletotrichum graminicola M1.001]